MFSREYLYYKCVLQHRCLGVTLKMPLIIEGKTYSEIYILDIESDNDITKKQLMKNIENKIDTTGKITIKFFIEGDVVDKGALRTSIISTTNIEEVHLAQ